MAEYPPPACVITSATKLHAPDGTADKRTTIAVSEKVKFTAGGAATWAATAGTPVSAAAPAATFEWQAPEAAGAAAISATYGTPAHTCTLNMRVVLPASISMRKTSEDAIPAGIAGAGMMCEVTFNPLNVSFGNSAWLEEGGPASGVTGYFTAHAGQPYMNHVPNPNWVGIGANNKFNSDHCSAHGWPSPWSVGTFQWAIPNRIGVSGSSGAAAGTASVGTVQSFAIAANGTFTVSKQGASVTRSP